MKILFAGGPRPVVVAARRQRFGEKLEPAPIPARSDEVSLSLAQKRKITDAAVRVLQRRIGETQAGHPAVAGMTITVTPFPVQREASIGYPKGQFKAVSAYLAGLDGMLEEPSSKKNAPLRSFKFYPDAIGDKVNVITVRIADDTAGP